MIFHKNVQIVIWVPEGSRGAPGDPAESHYHYQYHYHLPIPLPSDDLQMATVYEKSMRTHTFCKIDVKLVSKSCKTKNSKICGRFPLYFICFLSGWNVKFLTTPGQTVISHDIHYNYKDLKCMWTLKFNDVLRPRTPPYYGMTPHLHIMRQRDNWLLTTTKQLHCGDCVNRSAIRHIEPQHGSGWSHTSSNVKQYESSKIKCRGYRVLGVEGLGSCF